MIRNITLLLVTLGLSACGSVLSGATQDITVETPGAHDSVCYIDNGDLKYRVWPPETVKVSRRPGNLEVRCLADGNREKTVVFDSDGNAVALGNVLTGLAPGMFIDHNTGSLYEYPRVVTVDFTDIPTSPMPKPNYHKHLMENPDLFGMEEFRPGRAALIKDKYNTSTELKKREFLGAPNYDEFKGGASSSISSESSEAGDNGAGQEEASAGGSTSKAASNAPPSDLVSDLTRQMNPQVFGPSSDDSGFIGGTNTDVNDGGMDAGPVTIYPIEQQ